MNTCRVSGCKFKKSHVALGHRCGSCQQYGHGEVECGNKRKITKLKKMSKNDKMKDDSFCSLRHVIDIYSKADYDIYILLMEP